MIAIAGRLASFVAALGLTALLALPLVASSKAMGIREHFVCICIHARNVNIEMGFGRPLPPVTLLRPKAPVTRAPDLICEMPGDPATVVPCDSKRIAAG